MRKLLLLGLMLVGSASAASLYTVGVEASQTLPGMVYFIRSTDPKLASQYTYFSRETPVFFRVPKGEYVLSVNQADSTEKLISETLIRVNVTRTDSYVIPVHPDRPVLKKAASPSGVRMLDCAPKVQFRTGANDSGTGAATVAVAHIARTAVFPNPASAVDIGVPYTMKCPKFTASATLHNFTISGRLADIWPRLAASQPDGDPDLDRSEYTPGKVNIYFDGQFDYPNIREDWSQEGISAVVRQGRLVFEAEGYPDIYFKQAIIGARVNGGKLQPVWFDKKLTQVKHGPRDVVEIYTNDGDGNLADVRYMKIDFDRGVVTLRNDVPFPSK